jgi:hypothetical protein
MTFTTLHIMLTAALTGVAALIVGMWRLPRERWPDHHRRGRAGGGSGRVVAIVGERAAAQR